MKKRLWLISVLFIFSILPAVTSGQQGQAMFKIVKGDDGTVKIYDMQGHELGNAAPTATGSEQAGNEIRTRSDRSRESIKPKAIRQAFIGSDSAQAKTNTIPADLGANSDKQVHTATMPSLNPGPDLTFGYINADLFYPYLTLDARIINKGTASSEWCIMEMYLAFSPNILLGSMAVNSLGAGEYQDLRMGFDISPYQGTWYVIWVVDSGGVIAEDDEGNNSAISPNLIRTSGPNLTSQRDKLNSSYNFNTHQLDINLSVVNNGNARAGSSVVGFYLSKDGIITSSDSKLGDLPVFSLGPGSSSDKTFTVSDVCNYVPPGSWDVGFIIDETNAVAELNEEDNSDRIAEYTFNCPLPNLTVSGEKSSYTYNSTTRQLHIEVRIINNGSAKAESSELGLYLSPDPDISTSDLHCGGTWHSALDPGSYTDLWMTTSDVCGWIAAGTWYVGCIIDNANTVAESSETDNTYSFTPPLTVEYFLTTEVKPSGSGNVIRNPDKSGYSHNESVQLKANAAAGYRFDHWSVDLRGTNNPATLFMDKDKSIAAVFAKDSVTDYILVTNCDDAGPGSLREAITVANSHTGPDTILFAIPQNVPGYQADAGIWVIQPKSNLPLITDGKLLINGLSQAASVGRDTNPEGPEVVLDGQMAGPYVTGLHSTASEITIIGLTIHYFDYVGLWMDHVDTGKIAGCYIGTDYRGLAAAPNGWGICIGNRSRNVTVGPVDTFRTIITGNSNGGILVSDSSTAIRILSNLIGMDRTARAAPGNNGFGGLCIQEHCDSVVVTGNLIGGNACGLLINNSAHNRIQSNWIGISPEYLEPKPGDLIPITGNRSGGIHIAGASTDNLISDNLICQNEGPGVGIEGEQPLRNRISRNGISQNTGPGIEYNSAGANRIPAPIITQATSSAISGTAIPDATIELYTDAEDEGQIFQGAIHSGPDGHFSWTGVLQGPLTHVTALAINAEGSTSSFSPAFVTGVEEKQAITTPAMFSLGQNYPNPFNPETRISYTIPRLSRVRLKVYDLVGKEVAILVDEVKQPGEHQAIFNGAHSPSGLYFYTLEADGTVLMQKMMLLK